MQEYDMVPDSLHGNEKIQLLFGLVMGTGFGFFLQKGGVTQYDVIIGQLLLVDFTVLKVMLTAVIIGMAGLHLMKSRGWIKFHTFPGSVGASMIGGLLFGIGFGVLGYCPGTVAGAVGQGQIDALIGGVGGILVGSALFATFYPWINRNVLNLGRFPAETIPELTGLSWRIVVPGFIICMTGFLAVLEYLQL
jgi:hypothetical protein